MPSADERALVAHGRILQISIDARFYNRPHQIVTWQDVAAGNEDAALTRMAEGISSLKRRVFVTFDHEPDLPRRFGVGTAADFVVAWRHVHALFARAGANNVVWVWVVTGSPTTQSFAVSAWPGNDVVDWISWESYNGSGCRAYQLSPDRYQSFAQTTLPFLRYLDAVHDRYNIDIAKPMMISEAGSVIYPSRPELTAQWYRGIPAVLRSHPQIKAVSLWDHVGTAACNYRFDGISKISDAVRSLSKSPVFDG
ncbi:MAG TPA: hypothetical protein VGH43_11300 [Jatrophihabitans sp.]